VTCYNCSLLLIDMSDERSNDRANYLAAQRAKGRARFDRIKRTINPRKTCPHCNAPQPVFKEESGHMVGEFASHEGSKERILFSAERVR
jgi:hypothetical protein